MRSGKLAVEGQRDQGARKVADFPSGTPLCQPLMDLCHCTQEGPERGAEGDTQGKVNWVKGFAFGALSVCQIGVGGPLVLLQFP